jgi:hypothetical protein
MGVQSGASSVEEAEINRPLKINRCWTVTSPVISSIFACSRAMVSLGSMMMVKSRNGDDEGSFDGRSDPTTLIEIDHDIILN